MIQASVTANNKPLYITTYVRCIYVAMPHVYYGTISEKTDQRALRTYNNAVDNNNIVGLSLYFDCVT